MTIYMNKKLNVKNWSLCLVMNLIFGQMLMVRYNKWTIRQNLKVKLLYKKVSKNFIQKLFWFSFCSRLCWNYGGYENLNRPTAITINESTLHGTNRADSIRKKTNTFIIIKGDNGCWFYSIEKCKSWSKSTLYADIDFITYLTMTFSFVPVYVLSIFYFFE
jgi:hypothetical protein